jgi:ABC-type Mn2+/Zn2+ transport system ATPase subunit
MTASALQLQNLIIGYPGRTLSNPLSLEIPVGTSLGIIGGNGTGKTTLVKTLMGLIPPLQGGLHWKQGTTFGYVPQESQIDMLFPLTVFDLLKMGMIYHLPRLRRTSRTAEKAASSILDEMEIHPLKEHLVRNLSGGMRQRALIARAWISKPQVLIMDEPFNSLDHVFKEKLWNIFAEWKKNHELTLVIIDHDLNRIINQVDWAIVLGPQGTISGPTAEVINPENLSKAYGAPLHVHQENGHLQVHFL